MSKKKNRDKEYEIVAKALQQYDIGCVNAEFFCEESNVLYKVYGDGGVVYGLKIWQEESSKLEDNLCEAFYLYELAPKIDFSIPEVVLNKDGIGVAVVESDSTALPKRATLFKWVGGKDLDGSETDELLFELGRMTAQMHKAAMEFDIPESIKPKRWDEVFYFRDEPVVFRNEPFAEKLGEENVELLDKAIKFANRHLESMISKYQLLLMHGDINPWNVLLKDGKLALIDFEDCIIGYAAQEIAIILYYYRYAENYRGIRAAVLKGYNSVFPEAEFDELEIEVLMLARRLNFINYSMDIDDDPWEYVDMSLKRVKGFFDKYGGLG